MVHVLKILPCYFNAHLSNIKPYEIRLNDRIYMENDILNLHEWAKDDYENWFFTGRILTKRVVAVYSFPEYLKEGYVILTVKNIRKKVIEKLMTLIGVYFLNKKREEA